MTYAAGALSKTLILATEAKLASAAATGGTGPYTYQWYRGTVNNFTAASSNSIAGATSLTLDDTGLAVATQYYYKVIATDTGNANATATSSQLAVLTNTADQSQNQFDMQPLLATFDQAYNYNTKEVIIDSSSAGGLKAGQAVKCVNNTGGPPKVVECSSNADDLFGFIAFNIKNSTFNAGDRCAIGQSGNVMYLRATGTIARAQRVQLDLSRVGGVAQLVGSSGAAVAGWSYDGATEGQLLRVELQIPGSFSKA